VHSQAITLGGINVVGGLLVLGSYAQGIITHPANRDALWGGVPESVRPVYTAGMLLAAAGYFAFTYFILFRLDPDQVRIAGRFGYSLFFLIYALILVPSAMWMPLTYASLDHPGEALRWTTRLVLIVVGLASLGLLAALLTLSPKEPAWAHRLAVAGIAVFSIQTAVLDAIVWSVYFPGSMEG